MPASGDGTGWDIASPADTDLELYGAQEIRDLRTGVGIRVNKEHVALAAASVGGEHKAGSAVVYVVADVASLPTKRPDGTTNLDTSDKGRIALVVNIPWYWTGTAWSPVSSTFQSGTVTVPNDGSYSSRISVGKPFLGIYFYHSGVNFFILNVAGTDQTQTPNSLSSTGTLIQYDVDTRQTTPNWDFRIRQTVAGVGPSGTTRYQVIT